jgi:hypothetical protein
MTVAPSGRLAAFIECDADEAAGAPSKEFESNAPILLWLAD